MNKKLRLGLLVGTIAAGFALAEDQPGIKDLPDVKEGLWESSTMMPGAMDKPMRTTMCTSNAVNRKMYEDSHKNTNSLCKEVHSERHGAVITQEIECNFGGKVTRSTSVTTLTGNTGMKIEMRKADNTVESLIEMKWVGACPAGMKLGDVTGPDGKVMMNALTP
ncbi:MAG: DUF3617 family protein [Steroidobacteraceae bacterium]|jgi:hypothetical protein